MTRSLVWLSVLFLFITGCGPQARDFEQVSPEEKLVLKFSHVVSDTSPKGRAARRWAELVAQKSEGRVEIQVFANSTLFKDGEELEALRKGYVQIIAPATSKLTKTAPALQILDLPFFFADEEEVHRVVDDSIKKELAGSFKQHGMEYLAYWDNGFKQMTANVPLRKAQDFRGSRFRIMDSPVLFSQFRRLGAEPVATSFSDVYTALESQYVGGSENTASNLYSKKFYQLQNYLTVSNHGYLGYAVLVNSEQWKALPYSVRRLLTETLAEVTEWERQEALKQNRDDLERLRKEKALQVYDLSPEDIDDWRNALSPLYQEVKERVGPGLFQKVVEEKVNKNAKSPAAAPGTFKCVRLKRSKCLSFNRPSGPWGCRG